jgi:hypothetical protein
MNLDDDWIYDEEGENTFFDDEEDLLDLPESEEENTIDLAEYQRLAERKILFHHACTLGNQLKGNSLAALFLSEAELFLNNCDYKSALITALASEMVACDYEPDSIAAVETICLYQLGDRSQAERLGKQVTGKKISSVFLRNRFENTLEVLTFMPQLLSMLAQQGARHGDHF